MIIPLRNLDPIIIELNTGTYLKFPSGVVTYSEAEPQFRAITTLLASIGLELEIDESEIIKPIHKRKDIFVIFFIL